MPQSPRLAPLLSPRSIAFVGASARPDTPGNDMLRMVRRGGFGGEVFAVNPGHPEIEGFACLPSLSDLPAPPDLVVLSVRNERLEATLAEAISVGAGAAVVFASAVLPDDPGSRDPAGGAGRKHAGLRPELHGLLQRSRSRLDLRLPERPPAAARRHRPDRAFRQRVRRAVPQRSPAALRLRRLAGRRN